MVAVVNDKCELKLTNLICIRKILDSLEVQKEIQKMFQYISNLGTEKVGSLITASYGVHELNGQQKADIEILVPVNKKINNLDNNYYYKGVFYLTNALHIRHTGSLNNTEETFRILSNYIIENKLQVITPIYNVHSNEDKRVNFNEEVMDVYVGISPNIL